MTDKEDTMLSFLLHWLILAVALFVAVRLVPGVSVTSYTVLAVAALVVGFVNAFIRPVLALLSLPLTILTLGLFYLVVNGACLMIAAAVVPGFRVDGCFPAILGALVMSIVGWVIHMLLPVPPRMS
jgi:putative membrane protein